MATEESLNHNMQSALKHYSSMFFLPAFRKAVSSVAALCIGGVSFSTLALFPSFNGLIGSLLLGVSVFAAVIFSDYITSRIVLAKDAIYVLRRTVALSLFCWILWMFFIIIGVSLGAFFDLLWWIKICLLGLAAVITFRAVVFIATSSVGFIRRLISSLFSPLLCITPFIVFWVGFGYADILQLLPFLAVSTLASCSFAFLFIFLVDQLGRQMYGVPSMPLFRAFMLNWVAALNAPFEAFLEKLGENEDIEVTLMKFDSSKPKAAIIVPLVHPGPFKNIGSSLLPSLLKRDFEAEFGCDTCVPLGILGHELDLASQTQNLKIIDQVIKSAKFSSSASKGKPFVRVTKNSTTASCQIFGKSALISFTLAPRTTEDLPQELGRIVNEEAKKLGLDCSIVINAHNSINDLVDVEASIDTLREVAIKCLKKAVSLPSYAFEVGASTVFPKGFSLKDGMGSGGITAIVVNVAEQKTAYVVIDGNNMVSGLREEILSALKSVGFHESEIFTTDTHAVSAVVLGRRGYHPVGEVMNREALIWYIKEVTKKAASNLESCNAGCLRLVVPRVRVIGEERLSSLSMLVDKALRRAKQIVAPIFVSEGLLLLLLLSFF